MNWIWRMLGRMIGAGDNTPYERERDMDREVARHRADDAYYEWCWDRELDPDSSASAVAYEEWYETYGDINLTALEEATWD